MHEYISIRRIRDISMKWDIDMQNEYLQLREKGHTETKIAQILGITRFTLWKKAKELGLPPAKFGGHTKGVQYNIERNNAIYADYKSGITRDELSRKYNLCRSRIDQILRE